MLGGSDVGRRVVVRHRTPLGVTDVLGELTGFGEGSLTVRTQAGEVREIAHTAVLAGKPVGPRPPRYSEIIALEQIADRAWPAPDVTHLGQWLLRAAQGFSNRANSALPLGTAAGSLEETVAACERFYRDRGLPPKISVPLPVRRDVARHLDAAGWLPSPVVLVQTAPLTGVPVEAAPVEGAAVELRPEPSPEFLTLIAARKHELPAAAHHVLTEVPAVRFAHAHAADGTLVAIARGAVIEQWLHLGLVEVVPEARRQGHARVLMGALATWAAGLGATHAVLQVEQRNEPAVRLYQGLGFSTHHTYLTYRAA